MSGGRYNYASFNVNRIIEDLKEEKSISKDSAKCKNILIKELKKMSKLLYDLEWYDSGDYGEDELKKLIRNIRRHYGKR